MLSDHRCWLRILLIAMLAALLPTIPALAGNPAPTATTTPVVVVSPTNTPPQRQPVVTATPAPTDVPAPTDAPKPTDVPAPTDAPKPTDAAKPADTPARNVQSVAPARPSAPTFTVLATRQGLVGRRTANGHRIRPRDRFVALPSWLVLSNRNSNEFQVRVTYRGRSVVLPVWDVGPWNTHDEYWSPNRRYSDLPVGVPMAQAAHRNGYNGGRDEFGRRIRMPNGIDIADGAFWDDLGMKNQDWVQVTFLWMGEDLGQTESQPSGSDEPGQNEPGTVLVNDSGDGYSSQSDTNWYDANCGIGGRHLWTYVADRPENASNSANWKPNLKTNGFFEAFAYIPSCGPKATSKARYKINHEGSTTEVVIDQNAASGRWVSLGVYRMAPGQASVDLSDYTGEDDLGIRFDAIKFVPRTDSSPPDAKVSEANRRDDGTIMVRWQGSDDVAGIASYDIQVRRLPDGNWTDWRKATTDSQASFTPPEPGAYAFRARARDWAGHEQGWRESDDVSVKP